MRSRATEPGIRRSPRRPSPAWILIALVVAGQAIVLAHELAISRLDLNDNVFHYRLAARTAEEIERGGHPFDFWVSEWTLGYPVPRTYQPLGHVMVATCWLAIGKSIELMTVFVWARYLLLCLWPITVYISARALTLRPPAAVAAALIAPLVATEGLFGLELGSYLWRGTGLFTQSLAMHLFALSLGLTYRALASGRHLTATGVVLGLTFLAHFIYGYMAALSVVLLASISAPRRRRLLRTAWIGTTAFAVTAFHLIPLLLDAPLINRSRWEPTWKWDSFGAREVLTKLVSGDLLDAGRFPSLSLLALIGLIIAVMTWRSPNTEGEKSRVDRTATLFLVTGAVGWLLLFCGRPTWGSSLGLLGLGETTHLHRLIGGAHFFLILLTGLGLGAMWSAATRLGRPIQAASLFMMLALLLPAIRERLNFVDENRQWGRQNLEAQQTEQPQLAAALTFASREPGRIFPGLGGGWGKDFRTGWIPFYAHLGREGIPALAYLYHAMALTSDIMVHFDEWKAAHYRLFNVSSVLAPTGQRVAPFLNPGPSAGRFQLWHAPASGWFALVTVPDSATVDTKSFYDVNKRWLDSGWLAAGWHLRLDIAESGGPTPTLDDTAERQPLGRVEWEERDREVYRARVRVDRSAHLLFKMTHHRHWRVEVNGEERPTVMLSPGFVGVELEPGGYEIACRYRPPMWRVVLMWLVLPVVLVGWRLEKRWASSSRDRSAPRAPGRSPGTTRSRTTATRPVQRDARSTRNHLRGRKSHRS